MYSPPPKCHCMNRRAAARVVRTLSTPLRFLANDSGISATVSDPKNQGLKTAFCHFSGVSVGLTHLKQ